MSTSSAVEYVLNVLTPRVYNLDEQGLVVLNYHRFMSSFYRYMDEYQVLTYVRLLG